MSSRNWSNSSPLPPSPRQVFLPTQSAVPIGRMYNNHGLNIYDNPYSAYAPGPVYDPYAMTTPDPRFRPSFNMSNLGTLNSRALVAAALGPAPNQEEPESHGQVAPGPAPRQSSQRPQIGVHTSSPLTEPLEEDFISDVGRNINSAVANKRSSRSKKRRHSELSDADEEYVENAPVEVDEKPAKTRKTRNSTKRRALRRQVSSEEEEDISLPTPPKKVVRRAKLPAKRLIRKKPQGTKVPETLQEAGTADKMMWLWKNSGRDWEDIRIEWQNITGIKPGKSSLSVRYIKLNENFARNGAAGDMELIKFRKEAEEELMMGLWDKVAEKMLAFNSLSEHNPKDLKKRYDLIVRSGFDLEKLLAEDATKQEEEEAQKQELVTHSVRKLEDEVDADLLESALHESAVEAAARSAKHDIQTFHSSTISGEANLSHVLTKFTDGTNDNVDYQYPSESITEDMVDQEPAMKTCDAKEQSTIDFPAKENMIPASPAAPSLPDSSSFNHGLVAYESDSD